MAGLATPQSLGWRDWSIYIILTGRGDGLTFHSGLVMTRDVPDAHVWHAINSLGSSTIEDKAGPRVLMSKTMCCAYQIGVIDQDGWTKSFEVLERMRIALYALPGGPPAAYNCSIFVREAVQQLHDNGVITLTTTVPALFQNAHTEALEICREVELGIRPGHIWNDTRCSTTTWLP